MKKALILHGCCDAEEYLEMDFPSPSNAHWLPWLQQKFLRAGVLCQTPEMPKPYEPQYADWVKCFAQFVVNDQTTIVGHSAGCGFILKWLHENPGVHLEKLVLVAPWFDPSRRRGSFVAFALSPELQGRVGQIHVFYSTDEEVEGVRETKDQILQTYPKARLHQFTDKGHFCIGEIGTEKFEELWTVCRPSL